MTDIAETFDVMNSTPLLHASRGLNDSADKDSHLDYKTWRLDAGVWWLHDGVLYAIVAIVVGSYTLSQHKEYRFVLVAMQLLMPLVGFAVAPLLGSPKRAAFPQTVGLSSRHIPAQTNGRVADSSSSLNADAAARTEYSSQDTHANGPRWLLLTCIFLP